MCIARKASVCNTVLSYVTDATWAEMSVRPPSDRYADIIKIRYLIKS